MIDQSEVGRVVAAMMDRIERDAANGDLPEDVEIVRCMVIVEARHRDEEGDKVSAVHVEITDGSNVVGLGLVARAYGALME